ncbi:SDR family NAD(P)-dependent oxidoreductase [Streptomyces olivoreticuli]|uniref:SDR family NAD(P)-dependent oxidoreductase n=1 Tax=Streptomyces olivoreticuli TaxID=68246 RepID=UPI000E274446|nr:SDR family NAD(P)-dependent oxidoreductase [Streptomyces olivoreticuli]
MSGQANYAASKTGLVGLARTLTHEFGTRNVTATVVAPGCTETDVTALLTDHQHEHLRSLRVTMRCACPRRPSGWCR